MVQDSLEYHWCLSKTSCPGERRDTEREGWVQGGVGRKAEERDEKSKLQCLHSHLQGASPLALDELAEGADSQHDAARSS